MRDRAQLERAHHVTVLGAGDATFVLAHGLGSDQRAWGPVAAGLARDARVVLFDHAGSGEADPAAFDPDRHRTLDGYAQDLAEVLAAFGGPRPLVVGHSIGGTIALLSSLLAPGTIAGLVLLAPSPRYLDDPPDYRGGFTRRDVDELLDLMERNFLGWAAGFAGTVAPQPEVADGLRRSLAASDRGALRSFAEVTFTCDVRDRLAQVTTPSLVVQCAEDAVVPVPVGEAMARSLPGASYRLIDVAGHFPHVSHPALVEGIVREFAGRP